MNIEIKRTYKKGYVLDGTLYIDGVRVCDCAENAESAIPAGTYHIVRHKCKQYGRFVPLIMKPSDTLEDIENRCSLCDHLKCVTNNTTLPCFCPQIKPGNGVYHRNDGSIIVGTRICPGCLKHIKEPFENICERIRKLDSRGSEITFTITEDYPPERHPLTNFELGQQILKQF